MTRLVLLVFFFFSFFNVRCHSLPHESRHLHLTLFTATLHHCPCGQPQPVEASPSHHCYGNPPLSPLLLKNKTLYHCRSLITSAAATVRHLSPLQFDTLHCHCHLGPSAAMPPPPSSARMLHFLKHYLNKFTTTFFLSHHLNCFQTNNNNKPYPTMLHWLHGPN